ncbi:MAG: DUF3298 domain-containing protein [Lachnospiraceae bacterium]|nr:DUF3298 domain-containing protein [Lachnospiraceae bacterium]MCI9674169.1 DUF3298 domain-containing protein [Lachnospiraceae bacterium]
MKPICCQGAGSGAQWNYFYTVGLNTENRLTLPDLFMEVADYITPVSDNIKDQMRSQMKADSSKMYWVDYTEVPEWNLEQLRKRLPSI